MTRYIKLDKIESLPTDSVLDDIPKSLQDWVWEAYKKGIQEQIVANTIIIDKHFAKTNRILVGNLNIPPMICGLEIKLTEELPEGYNFALVEAPETERDRIIKKAKFDIASEIFEEIERIILDNTYPDFNREHKPVNIWKAKTGYDALDELKKKYMED